jgi:hypothetical protein
MSSPRRRLVRPAPIPAPTAPDRPRRLLKLRARLQREQATLSRWMSRLRRAFHAVEKQQLRVVRLEKQIARLEE